MATTQQQKQRQTWKTSLWDFQLGEFRQFIKTIDEEDRSRTIPDAFYDFRELPCFPHIFRQMTIGELSQDSTLIEELHASREGMQAEREFKLGCKPKAREVQLIQSLDKVFGDVIDFEKAKARVFLGRHESEQQTYCYALEIAIAPRIDQGHEHAGESIIIDSINNSVSSKGRGYYFQGGDYKWQGKKGNQKGIVLAASTIQDILYQCGFIRDSKSSRVKKPCILFIQLKSRVINWMGAKGKSQIDVHPFAKHIAEIVSDLADKMPSYYGQGGRWTEEDEEGNESDGIYRPYLRDFLVQRRDGVESDPLIRIRDRLTQSGVWYRIRPIMIADGFKPRKKVIDKHGRTRYAWGIVRKGLTTDIREVIEELWPGEGITREYLGIVANARAMMYFNGQVFPIDFDSKESLAMINTTDLIVVEKAGITDVLLEAAKKYRIALISTGGYFSDYVEQLMKNASAEGINVCVLSDYDLDGLHIHRITEKKLGIKITRIGITRDTIKWLCKLGYKTLKGDILKEGNVEEEYDPNSNYLEKGDDEYLLTKRIELDSIVQEVGADALWDYIVFQLNNEFPEDRDYREVMEEPDPENYYTEEMDQFLEYIHDYFRAVCHPKWQEIKEIASKVKGLAQVDYEEVVNDVELKDVIHDDEGTKKISQILKDLLESEKLPKIPKIDPEPEDFSNETSQNYHADLEYKFTQKQGGGYL